MKAREKAIANIDKVFGVLYRLLLILFIKAIIQKQIGICYGEKNGEVYYHNDIKVRHEGKIPRETFKSRCESRMTLECSEN